MPISNEITIGNIDNWLEGNNNDAIVELVTCIFNLESRSGCDQPTGLWA